MVLEHWCPMWGGGREVVVRYTSTLWSLALSGFDTWNTREWWNRMGFQHDAPMKGMLNPLTLSLNWTQSPSRIPNNVTLHLLIGVDIAGTDPIHILKIRMRHKRPPISNNSPINTSNNSLESVDVTSPLIFTSDYQLSPVNLISQSTGYGMENVWLSWLAAEAQQHISGQCVACASAGPRLYNEPTPLCPSYHWGYACMLQLTKYASPANCTT